MKIAYDGKRAVRNLTGLGNYSRLIIETMSAAMPGDDHIVYVPDMRPNPRLETLLERDNVVFCQPARYWSWPKAAWRSWGVTMQAERDNVDVYHGLSNELPFNIHLSPVASVVTIHDVIYRRMPECYKPADRYLYDLKYGWSVRHADRVIAISEATKRDVMELYGVPEKKITVIRQGCDPNFSKTATLEQRRRLRQLYKLPARYLIQVGTIEKRKNLELTLRALSGLPDDIHLVAVGSGGKYMKEMVALAIELGVRSRFHILQQVPFTDLPALYQMALASVYPSRYEGFGIPVLESLAGGTPTIISNSSALPEAGGDAAFQIGVDDVRGLADTVRAIVNGGGESSRITGEDMSGITGENIERRTGGDSLEIRRERGKRHAATFAADDISHRIQTVYEAAIKAHSRKK